MTDDHADTIRRVLDARHDGPLKDEALAALDALLAELRQAQEERDALRAQEETVVGNFEALAESYTKVERERREAIDALRAIQEKRCNGCKQPQKRWGPICPGMNQGDFSHYHSPEWWTRAALVSLGEQP